MSQGMTFGAKRVANQYAQQPATITFGAKQAAVNQQPTTVEFNLERELNSIDEDKTRICNEVQRLCLTFNPADKKTESLERKIKEIVRLTREFWKLHLIRWLVEEDNLSRAYFEKKMREEKVLETTALGNYIVKNVCIFGNEVFFSLFTPKEIAAGFPRDENFSSVNETQMQLLLCDLIPDYRKRIVLFGENLKYLDEYQVSKLTIEQIKAIKNANINFPQDSPIFQKINGRSKKITQNEEERPPTEKSKCCLII